MNTKIFHSFRHVFDFFILLLIIGIGLMGILFFRFDSAAQVAMVILMSTLYVFWGVFHHLHDNNLTREVILEYIGMALLGAFILIVFLLRA